MKNYIYYLIGFGNNLKQNVIIFIILKFNQLFILFSFKVNLNTNAYFLLFIKNVDHYIS